MLSVALKLKLEVVVMLQERISKCMISCDKILTSRICNFPWSSAKGIVIAQVMTFFSLKAAFNYRFI